MSLLEKMRQQREKQGLPLVVDTTKGASGLPERNSPPAQPETPRKPGSSGREATHERNSQGRAITGGSNGSDGQGSGDTRQNSIFPESRASTGTQNDRHKPSWEDNPANSVSLAGSFATSERTNASEVTLASNAAFVRHSAGSPGGRNGRSMSAQSAISEDGGFVKPDVNTWQESKSLVECNRYMMTYEVDCDITFLVGSAEEEVKGHIFVMTSRSGKMASLLAGQRIYPDIKLKIPDIEPDSFRDYLLYLYTDEVELDNVGRARELIRAAHRYGPKSLQDRCFSFLLTEISADNVCVTLELAHSFNENNIFERCFRFINVNAVDVLKAINFPDLCEECVDRVLTSDALNADEFEVYDAVIRWADGKCARKRQRPTDETRREVLGSLLFSVRFAIMDVDEFTHKLSTKDVLSLEEKVVLYQFYHGEVNVLPDMFNRTPRRQYRQRDHVDNTSPLSIDGNRVSRIERMNIVSLPREEDQRFQRSSMRRVTRFWGIGGPWDLIKGTDAIRFHCSKVIILRGIEIFGPYRGTEQYNVSVTLTDDLKTEVRKESFTIDAKVPAKKTYDVIFTAPVRVPPNRLFTISVLMKGAPCLQGLNGTSTVETEGVTFQFMNSNVSFNGTDVSVGQIPSILFSL